jgi:hypothetical membrane protein
MTTLDGKPARIGRIELPALIAAILGPIQVITGFNLAQAFWPEFDWVHLTISDLAADTAPTQVLMTSFFYLGGTLSIITATWAKSFALPGRIAILLAGLATYGLAFFKTSDLPGEGVPHRIFAIISFVLMSGWPLFAMRKNRAYPWILRPVWSIAGTVLLTIASLIFLASWRDPNATMTGVWERIIAVGQTWYMGFVIWACWLAERKTKRLQ